MPRSAPCYKKGIVIVHGKSEWHLVRHVYTNLHLPLVLIARDKGKSSIQINGLLEYMNRKCKCKSLKTFAEEHSIEYDRKNKILKNFKLFTIMDTDDCEEETRKKYISGELFRGHPLAEYIVPIYNSPNLEEIMIRAEIMTRRIRDSEKGTYYSKIFPLNTEPMSVETIHQVRIFASKLKGIRESNLMEFMEYCFELLPDINL